MAALASLPGSLYAITTPRSAPAFASGSSVWARSPVLFSASFRQRDMLFTVTGIAVPPSKYCREYLTSSAASPFAAGSGWRRSYFACVYEPDPDTDARVGAESRNGSKHQLKLGVAKALESWRLRRRNKQDCL